MTASNPTDPAEAAPAPRRHAHVRVDPRSYSIDRLFFVRIYKLCKPYWLRKNAWKPWLALAFLLTMGTAVALFGGYMSALMGDRTNSLVAKDAARFWQLWTTFTALGLGIFAVSQVQTFLSSWLNIDWRRWLTTHLIDEYLQHRTYYEITVDQEIDNPDQRIQEQVGPFCSTMSDLPQKLFTTSATMGVQFYVLMGISPGMLYATLAYVAVSTGVTFWLYKPTIRQNWDATVAEADLRYGLLHVRDNAETVAFYRGESAERGHLVQRLSIAALAQMRLLVYKIKMNGVEHISGLVWGALPFILIAPLYMEGRIGYGSIDQGLIAASLLMQSLSVLMNFIPELAKAVPMVVRLAEIQEKFEALGMARRASAGAPRVAYATGSQVALEQVSVQTPGGEQQLVRELTLQVKAGDHLVIVGQTGVGKSSLLRVMAGLWTRGTGRIEMPPPSQLLFLPQKPYMILGSLRSQLLYPAAMAQPPGDAALQAVLERVNLHDLAERHGGFDAELDWGRVLSLGEQQRVAFARVLVSKPRYVFLDEATSAVDMATEALLYGLLKRADTTFISVGHRPSLFGYHRHALRLFPGGGWTLGPAEAEMTGQPSQDTTSEIAA